MVYAQPAELGPPQNRARRGLHDWIDLGEFIRQVASAAVESSAHDARVTDNDGAAAAQFEN
ncbi:MAG: hypothetical protein GY842_26860 [bacterium]|nr:hypothetical protein [bacterium]